MKKTIIFSIFLCLLIIHEANSGRSGGGGSRGGGSRSGGSRGSSLGSRIKSGLSGLTGKKTGSSGIKSGTSGIKSGSKLGKLGKRLKGGKLAKIALVGAGVYGAYQIGKVAGKFSSWKSHGNWGYNDWNRWRQDDGMLCRTSQDCKWIDPNLFCQDFELDFSPTVSIFVTSQCAVEK